jgi:hypothetical protein
MVPRHKMHLNCLLTALQNSMKDVSLDHIMANPLYNSRPFSFFHSHLYLSHRKLDIYLSKLELISQNLIVTNAILILHGDWYINFLHKKKKESDFYYEEQFKKYYQCPH